MKNSSFDHLQKALDKRKEEGTLRALRSRREGIDFYSNDYLGLAGNSQFQKLLLEQIINEPQLLSGSTGSRLISGNSSEVTAAEKYIAEHHKYPEALVFPSGYNANLALFSTLPSRHDTIIVDEQIHRSIHDACKLSNAKKLKFKHNDLKDLEEILKRQTGQCYIAVESLYSMEGDLAPLQKTADLAAKYSAGLLIDEAHSFGVFGDGLVSKYGLQDKVLATVITYGKAMGAHGAAVLSSELIKSYLVNFASPFIYTTSAQDLQWRSIKTGYEFLKKNGSLSEKLQENISIFREQGLQTPSSENSPIQAVLVPDNSCLKDLQKTLFQKGFLTYAVYSPAVKAGTERLRICLHSFNTENEIRELTNIIKQFIK